MIHPRVIRFVQDVAYSVLAIWVASILIIQSKWTFEDIGVRNDQALVRAESKRIRELSFVDIVRYDAILPAEPFVFYGSEARHKSVYEVLPEIVEIKGGVTITWNEYIFCDHNPHDSKPQFSPYKEVEPTTLPFDSPRLPKTQEDLDGYAGYPAFTKRNNGFHGNLPPVEYPQHDADCYLQSAMLMRLPQYEMTKRYSKISEVVKVRGVIPD